MAKRKFWAHWRRGKEDWQSFKDGLGAAAETFAQLDQMTAMAPKFINNTPDDKNPLHRPQIVLSEKIQVKFGFQVCAASDYSLVFNFYRFVPMPHRLPPRLPLAARAFLFLFLWLASAPLVQAQWTQKANFGGSARQGGVGFSIGTKGYFGLGYDGARRNDFWQFDPATNTWAQVANFGGGVREVAGVFVIGSTAYVGFGAGASGLTSDLWAYNPTTNTWVQKASMPTAGRQQPACFAVNGKGYVGTGWNGGSNYNDFWEYDPVANTWTQKANYGGGAIRHAVGFAIGSLGYVVGGYTSGRTGACYAYDPSTNTWAARSSLPISVAAPTGCVTNGIAVVGTGDLASGSYSPATYAYNPTTNTWLAIGNLSGSGRQAAMAFAINDKAYFGCGNNASLLGDLWEYTTPPAPTLTSFTPTTAAPGASVTITGADFLGAQQVRFNGLNAASYTVNSATQITAVVPAGATPGPITVTTIGGTGASATNFNPVAVPYVSSFSPTNGAVGTLVTLTGINLSNVTSVLFGSSPAAFTLVSATQLTATVPASATTAPITVADALGSYTTSSSFTIPATITSFTPATGQAGSVVTINGSYLNTLTSVRFNTTTTTQVEVLSANQIQAIVPSGATNGPIRGVTGAIQGSSATSFTVTATVNQPPTSATLSATSVVENSPVGTTVGTLTATDATSGDTHTFRLIQGLTANDNAAFTIVGNALKLAISPDYETKTSYSIRVRTTDATGLAFDRSFTITIIDILNDNTAPSDIALSPASVNENVAANTTVGVLSSTDPDAGNTFTYALVSGTGSTDNASFSITGNTLRILTSPDYEVKSSYSIRVRTTDQGGLWFEKALTITINNVIDPPVLTSFSPTTGAISTVVTLSGSNFAGTTAVTFNGVNAPGFTVGAGGTQLTVAVPSGATTGAIRVVHPDGTATSATNYTLSNALTVSAADQVIQGGTYGVILLPAGGTAHLAGPVTVSVSLLVQSGATLDDGCQIISGPGSFSVAPGGTLRICHSQGISTSGATGAVQVTGSRLFSAGGNYVYDGTTAQITGTGLPNRPADLVVDNATGLTLTQPVTIGQRLVMANTGNLLLGGNNLTLQSKASGTALVVNAGGGVVVGSNVTAQVWTNNSPFTGQAFRHLSSPVQGPAVGDLTTLSGNFSPVVNAAYNVLPTPASVTPTPNVFGYDETRGPASASFADGYYCPTLTDPLDATQALALNCLGNETFVFTGQLLNGDRTITGLTKTGNFTAGTEKSGWHLLGNPFPSPLDWDLVTVPAGLSSSISVWKPTGTGNAGVYLTRAAGVGTLTDGILPMGQGFFARVTGAGPVSLTLPQNARVTTWAATPAHYRAAANPSQPVLSLTLRQRDSLVHDEVFVHFRADATLGADDIADGFKPGRNVGVPTLATLIDGAEAAVNGLPITALTQGLSLPLVVALPGPGTYELAVGQRLNLGTYPMLLVDHLTGTRLDLQASTAPYRFSVTQGGDLTGRFELVINRSHFAATPAGEVALPLLVWPNPASRGTSVYLSGLAEAQSVQLLDATGRVVSTFQPQASRFEFSLQGLPGGVYTVRSANGRTARLVVE